MKRKLLPILILTIIALTNINCQKMDNSKDKFDWQGSGSAPELYPVQLISGDFYKGDKAIAGIPSRHIYNNKWGVYSTTVGSTAGDKELPDGFGIMWFSYTENKFYTGSFDLPYDTIKKLFNEGYTDYRSKTKRTYDYIVVGMAPGGMLVVWLLAGGHQTIEIGRYQAEERSPIDLNNFLPQSNRWADWEDRKAAQDDFSKSEIEDYPKVKQNFDKKGLQLGLWDTYRQKFNIRVRPNYKDTTCITDEIAIEYYNGEEQTISLDKLLDSSFTPKPRISFLEVFWSFGRTIQYAEITMDEQEIFDAYKIIYGDNPNQNVELRIDINEQNDFLRVWLSAVGTEYPKEEELIKPYMKIYPMPEDWRHSYTVFKHEFTDK